MQQQDRISSESSSDSLVSDALSSRIQIISELINHISSIAVGSTLTNEAIDQSSSYSTPERVLQTSDI